MSRKSFQRVTLSVELTLPPGAKAKDAPMFLLDALEMKKARETATELAALDVRLAIIKIIKRETIYTN